LRNMPENTMRRPDGIVDRLIDISTGALATPGDPNTMFEYFRIENDPAEDQEQIQGLDPESEESDVLSTETIF